MFQRLSLLYLFLGWGRVCISQTNKNQPHIYFLLALTVITTLKLLIVHINSSSKAPINLIPNTWNIARGQANTCTPGQAQALSPTNRVSQTVPLALWLPGTLLGFSQAHHTAICPHVCHLPHALFTCQPLQPALVKGEQGWKWNPGTSPPWWWLFLPSYFGCSPVFGAGFGAAPVHTCTRALGSGLKNTIPYDKSNYIISRNIKVIITLILL